MGIGARARLALALVAGLAVSGCDHLRREYPVATSIAESIAGGVGDAAWHVTQAVEDFFRAHPPAAGRPLDCEPIGPEESGFYTVRDGDTLGEIGNCFGVDWQHLAEINDISDPDAIRVGEELWIHGAPAAAPQASAWTAPPVATVRIPSISANPKRKDGVVWQWPVDAGTAKRNSGGSGRQGITIAGADGQPIYAAADGQVAYSDDGPIGYGQLIILQHPQGYLSTYGHNSRLLVRKGQGVRRGDVIALMGRTAAPRPQLHFELRRRGKPVDPLSYLPELAAR